MKKNNLKTKRLIFGFTLIELLVIIAVISFLSTVAFVLFSSSRTKARVARQQAEVYQAGLDIALHKTDEAYIHELLPDTDSYFTVDSGSYALSNISDGDGYVASPLPGDRKSEVLAFQNSPFPNNSASDIYYYWNNNWRKVGTGAVIVNSTVLTQYFIIRNNSTLTISIILPSNVTYYGSGPINGAKLWPEP